MAFDFTFLREPRRVAAVILTAAACAAIITWLIVRGDVVGADARAYWGAARLWLSGGDPLAPPAPYLPYVYVPWSIPLFLPWAALPWESAWFVWRAVNVLLLAWTVIWAYRQHPLATAVFLAVMVLPLAATLDTGNVTFLCAMAVWAAQFTGPRLGGFLWALVTALKWFPLVLFPLLPPRTRPWGLCFLGLAALLSLAVWPVTARQLQLAIGYPRPLRIDYLLLLWAAVPWIWARPWLLAVRTWPEQLRAGRARAAATVEGWWSRPRRLASARHAAAREARSFLGLG